MIEADEVWLESDWLDWQIYYLPKSLMRLKEINSDIVLFGSKVFEITSASEYKNNFGLKGIQKEFEVSGRHKSLTAQLDSIARGIINCRPNVCYLWFKESLQHSFDGKGIISVDMAILLHMEPDILAICLINILNPPNPKN